MKLLKKILPFFVVLSVILSLFCFSVSAETNSNDLYYKNITPSGMFFYIEDYNGNVFRYIDERPNKVFDGNDYLYLAQLLLDEQQVVKGQNIFYCVNLVGDGFTFKQGINYTLKFKVIVPTRYTDGSTGFTFDVSGFSAGLFTWKSVVYENRTQYFQALTSPQVEKWYNNEGFEWVPYPYEYIPQTGNVHTFSYIDIEAEFVPSADTKWVSIGITLPFGNVNRWNGFIGIGGLKVGMPMVYAPVPGGLPNIDTGNVDNATNLEHNILNETTDGIIESGRLIQNFSSIFGANSMLQNGLIAVTTIFNGLFAISWVENLLTISLTFGIFAFVVGMSVFVVKSIRRRNKGGGG